MYASRPSKKQTSIPIFKLSQVIKTVGKLGFFLYIKICTIALDTQLALANKCGPTKDYDNKRT